MPQIRVKIRYPTSDSLGQVFCFDPSSSPYQTNDNDDRKNGHVNGKKGIVALMKEICRLLKVVPPTPSSSDSSSSSSCPGLDLLNYFDLTLEGDAILSDIQHIQHGDDLVLLPKWKSWSEEESFEPSRASSKSKPNNPDDMMMKKRRRQSNTESRKRSRANTNYDDINIYNRLDHENNNNNSIDNMQQQQDEECIDVTTEMKLKQHENQIQQSQEHVISLCSDDEAEEEEKDIKYDDAMDSSSDEGSVQDGSDAFESEIESDDDDNDDEKDSDFEQDEVDSESDVEEEYDNEIQTSSSSRYNKKRKSISSKPSKPPPKSPIHVIMKEKDVPSAPGKSLNENDIHNNNDPAIANSNSNDNNMQEESTLVDDPTGDTMSSSSKKADATIKTRIIKLLNTGFHDQSNEHEAKNAMRLAQRLMRKYNLSQALLLKERDENNQRNENSTTGINGDSTVLKGGLVRLKIYNRNTGKPAQFARWINDLMDPISKNFDVRTYHSTARNVKCNAVFYGVYTNAQLAGYAFKIAAERISQMTAIYKQSKNSIRKGGSVRSSRLCYALGIVRGISDEVDRNLSLEKERRERKLQRARLAVSSGEAYEESDYDDDDYDDDNDSGAGFSMHVQDDHPNIETSTQHEDTAIATSINDEEVKVMLNSNQSQGSAFTTTTTGASSNSPLENEQLSKRIQQLEQEQEATIVLVNHYEKIADQVLEENGIKLHKGSRRKSIQFDRESYDHGIEDAKEIDINQRALRDRIRVKKEC